MGLLLAVIVVFVVLGYMILRPTNTGPAAAVPLPKATYTLDATLTAKTTYPLAQEAVGKRQADAQLTSISATWTDTNVKKVGTPTGWTFQFYSPTTTRVYVVVVDQGQARLIREALSPYPATPIPEESWLIDSNEALTTWLNYGGGQFLMDHLAGTKVVAQLATSPEGQVTWTVTGLTGRGEVYLTLLVDAATGVQREP